MNDTSEEPSGRSEHLRLANILDQMPVGIGIFDSAGHLFHNNRHFERAAGGTIPNLHAMRGQYWHAFGDDGATVSECAYPGVRALLGQVVTPGIDFLRKTDDGQEHWVAISAVPLTAPGTSIVIGVVVVCEDANERRRQVEQLRAKEERFRRFARYSRNALWIANLKSGEIEFLSPSASKIWCDHGEIDTLDAWSRNIHPDDLQRAIQSRRCAAQGVVQRFEYRIVDQRGDVIRHVRETSFPIPGEHDEEDCIGGIVEDMTPEMQIYLVEAGRKNPSLLEELRRSAGRVKTFSCQEDLLNVAEVLNPGCVVVDLRGAVFEIDRIPAILDQRPSDLQIIFIGSAGTPANQAMDTMRAGAIDYLIEPFSDGAIGQAVQKACNAVPPRLETPSIDRPDMADRLSTLSKREREVLLGLVSGGTNKTIARQLEISPRTVEVHRAHLMERLNARNLSELLHLAHHAGMGPGST